LKTIRKLHFVEHYIRLYKHISYFKKDDKWYITKGHKCFIIDITTKDKILSTLRYFKTGVRHYYKFKQFIIDLEKWNILNN